MKRDILFLCQYFYPEYNSSAVLPYETACHLAKAGYTVDVFCGRPKEYCCDENVAHKETVNGVGIKRLRYLRLKRSSRLGRLINFISFTVSVLLHLFEMKKYRCVIVYSNPPVLPLVAVLAKAIFKTKIVFVSYDVYPEIAIASQQLTDKGIIAKVMRGINRLLFGNVNAVVALTEEMKNYLVSQRGIDKSCVYTVSNWATEEKGEQATNCLPDSSMPFTVAYFGNMGICQDMDTIIQGAALLAEEKQICFRLVGHGVKLTDVEQAAAALPQMKVETFLHGEEFEQAIGAADCCVVSLSPSLHGLCAPSKYYSYLNAGKPVIFIGDRDSYLAEEIRNARIGFAVENGSGEDFADAVLQMLRDSEKTKEFAHRAKALYQTGYAREHAMRGYQQLLKHVLEQ